MHIDWRRRVISRKQLKSKGSGKWAVLVISGSYFGWFIPEYGRLAQYRLLYVEIMVICLFVQCLLILNAIDSKTLISAFSICFLLRMRLVFISNKLLRLLETNILYSLAFCMRMERNPQKSKATLTSFS